MGYGCWRSRRVGGTEIRVTGYQAVARREEPPRPTVISTTCRLWYDRHLRRRPRLRILRLSALGRLARPACGLTDAAALFLPVADRARYAAEYRSELWDLAQRGAGYLRQLLYALRHFRAAVPMRRGFASLWWARARRALSCWSSFCPGVRFLCSRRGSAARRVDARGVGGRPPPGACSFRAGLAVGCGRRVLRSAVQRWIVASMVSRRVGGLGGLSGIWNPPPYGVSWHAILTN